MHARKFSDVQQNIRNAAMRTHRAVAEKSGAGDDVWHFRAECDFSKKLSFGESNIETSSERNMPSLSAFPKMGINDDSVYQVYLMCFARVDRRVRDNFTLTDFHDGPMGLDYNFFIIRNEKRTILVDTGFSPRAARQRGRTLMFDPIEGLNKIGIDPDQIEDILITHLHYDHAGNIDRFGKARFHVQDAEAAYATGRCMCNRLARFPFDVEDIVTLVRRIYADRVTFYKGDAEFLPGISLFALPGHSASVQSVRVMTERGPVFLASDATHYFANVLNGAPFMITLDMPQSLESYARMLELAGGVDRLIPGHDPKLRRLYPSVTINGIELFALHEKPRPFDVKELMRVDDFDPTVF